MRLHGRLLRIGLFIPLYLVTMVLVHELGHAMTAAYVMPADIRLFVWPGVELYPDWGQRYPEAWPDRIPALTYVLPRPSQFVKRGTTPSGLPGYMVTDVAELERMKRSEHVSKLMGSAGTMLLALVSLLLIALLKPKGIALWLLSTGALLHVDLLAGTAFPIFFDARHLYFWGSATPEAVDALTGMGISQRVSVSAILVLALLHSLLLYYLLAIKLRRRGQPL